MHLFELSTCVDVALFSLRSLATTGSCAEVAEWKTALDLLAQLRAGQVEEGGEPLDADTVSFNATINALGRGGEWKKAVALLREMTKAGLGVKVRCRNSFFHPFVLRRIERDACPRLLGMFCGILGCFPHGVCPPKSL